MKTLECNGTIVQLSDNGYLLSQDVWNEDVARCLAREEGIASLSEEQMEIIRFMREYFIRYKVFPILNNVCRIVHQPKQCVNEQFINPEKAWKIAGLPKQDGVYWVSLDGKHYFMEQYC